MVQVTELWRAQVAAPWMEEHVVGWGVWRSSFLVCDVGGDGPTAPGWKVDLGTGYHRTWLDREGKKNNEKS